MNAAKVLEDLKRRFPNEPEYHQAVEEVLSTIEEEYNKHPEFDKVNLIERLCIPDRVYQFRVTWMDDKGNIQTNMGYRVQHNNAIGPGQGRKPIMDCSDEELVRKAIEEDRQSVSKAREAWEKASGKKASDITFKRFLGALVQDISE